MPDNTPVPPGLFCDDSGELRCFWCHATPDYQQYHDTEWAWPVSDDRRLFEKICLEGFQAGLSWLTILNKRAAFRQGFANFDIDQLAAFDDADVQRLLLDAGIVRHRGKITAAINNARQAQVLRREFGSLAAYFWRFEPPASSRPKRMTQQSLNGLTTSDQAIALSKDLKKRGWRFVGPTTMYAFMQAMGLVNDHIEGCAARVKTLAARAAFKPPLP